MNLYVGNLPWGATEEELENHFSQYGTVKSVRIITEGPGGRSKGFGFVEMDGGQEAIDALDGKDYQGRDLKVNEAKPRD